MEADCPICTSTYDREEHAPIKIFCCSKTLCLSCLKNISCSTSKCPWDKKRWVQRSVIKKCMDNTPMNYLDTIQRSLSSQSASQEEYARNIHLLGDGSLKEEYFSQLKEIQRKNIAQIEKDDQLALEISRSEEAQAFEALRKNKEILMKDRQYAEELSKKINTEETKSINGDNNLTNQTQTPPFRKRRRNNSFSCQKNGILKYLEKKSQLSRQLDVSDNSTEFIELSESQSYSKTPSRENQEGGTNDIVSYSFCTSSTPSFIRDKSALLASTTDEAWNCTTCTFLNNGLLHECEICGDKKAVHITP